MSRRRARAAAQVADPEEPRPQVAYSDEGGGVVATCSACDWLAWKPSRVDATIAAGDHKRCIKGDVTLVSRRKRIQKHQRIYHL